MTLEELQAENEQLKQQNETQRLEYEAKLTEQRNIIQNLMTSTSVPAIAEKTAMENEIEKINKRRKFK